MIGTRGEYFARLPNADDYVSFKVQESFLVKAGTSFDMRVSIETADQFSLG